MFYILIGQTNYEGITRARQSLANPNEIGRLMRNVRNICGRNIDLLHPLEVVSSIFGHDGRFDAPRSRPTS